MENMHTPCRRSQARSKNPGPCCCKETVLSLQLCYNQFNPLHFLPPKSPQNKKHTNRNLKENLVRNMHSIASLFQSLYRNPRVEFTNCTTIFNPSKIHLNTNLKQKKAFFSRQVLGRNQPAVLVNGEQLQVLEQVKYLGNIF